MVKNYMHFAILCFTGEHAKIKVESSSSSSSVDWSDKFRSWWVDLKYLMQNISYVLTVGGAMCMVFFSGGLSFWAPHYIEDALDYRNASGIATPSEPSREK